MKALKRKFGINANCLAERSQLDALEPIKQAGFSSVFLETYENDEVATIKRKADALGLAVSFIHAPFYGINAMWLPGDDYLELYHKMQQTIDSAANNGIPAVVLHISSGWQPPALNDLGLSRFDALVAYGKNRGVILALENLRLTGNMAYFVDRYEKESHVQFCYDCGHEHCYTKTVRWMDIFTTRVFCTHIHDNPGRSFEDKVSDFDWHLLPFDGTCDYSRMMRDLDAYGYRGDLTLEVFQKKPAYEKWTVETFLRECYQRIERISQINE